MIFLNNLPEKFYLKNALVIEQLAKVDTIVFDKTGTLTKGEPEVIGLINKDVLFYAAVAEKKSEHPLAEE